MSRLGFGGLAATLVVLLGTSTALAQSRFGAPSPDDSFNRLLQSYGGSGDVLDYSKVSQEQRERTNRFAQFSGSEPMPASGTITRAEFADQFNKRMEAMRSRMGQPGGGMQPGASTQPVGGMQPSGGGGFRGMMGGGFDPSKMTDEQVAGFIQRSDADKDGKLNMAEASERLKPVFQQFDANRDGFIDVTEYRAYLQDRMTNRDGNSPGGSGPGGPPTGSYGNGYGSNSNFQPPSYSREERRKDEEPTERPVVVRFGKLPKEVPSWFEKLDTDQDGQIGLYEWRADSRVTAEFADMDLNSDGYLTAEEWIRHGRLALEKKTTDTSSVSTTPGFGGSPSRSSSSSSERPAFGGFGTRPGGKDESKKDNKDEKRRNPWGR